MKNMSYSSNNKMAKNISYLLNINKIRNKINRGHFCHQIKISRNSLNKWEHGGAISQKYIPEIINYFNQYLHLNLDTEQIKTQDLEMILKNSLDKVAEPDYNYNTLTKDEIELLVLYEQLPEDERIAFIEFLEKMAKSRER